MRLSLEGLARVRVAVHALDALDPADLPDEDAALLGEILEAIDKRASEGPDHRGTLQEHFGDILGPDEIQRVVRTSKAVPVVVDRWDEILGLLRRAGVQGVDKLEALKPAQDPMR